MTIGFQMVRTMQKNKIKIKFNPIDIVYKLVKYSKKKIDCYFTDKKSLAYITSYSARSKNEKIEYLNAQECFRCSSFYSRKTRFDKDVRHCSGTTSNVYKFKNQNLVTFEVSYKLRGHLRFATYFDFETTTTSLSSLEPHNSEMFPVSSVIIFAFHSRLNLDRIIIQRSLGYYLEKLTDVSFCLRICWRILIL